jgi:cell division septation protein DedD
MPAANIAAMLRGRTALVAAAVLVVAGGVSACGGDGEPEPSIPPENAETLRGTLDEIQANVDIGSCVVAAGKVQELQDELEDLPSDANDDLVEALQRGSVNLNDLVQDPDQCEARTETETTPTETVPTETEEPETTTERTQPPQTQTQQQTTTTQTTPTQPSGGVGPGTPGGL